MAEIVAAVVVAETAAVETAVAVAEIASAVAEIAAVAVAAVVSLYDILGIDSPRRLSFFRNLDISYDRSPYP